MEICKVVLIFDNLIGKWDVNMDVNIFILIILLLVWLNIDVCIFFVRKGMKRYYVELF